MAFAISACPRIVSKPNAPGPFNPGTTTESDGPLRIAPLQVFKDHDDSVVMSDAGDEHQFGLSKHDHMNYELRENPGLVPVIPYAIQHYLSIAGSLILIPLILVPAMGGTPEDTAKVVSSMLMVSGLSTLLHTSFGSRLPLIQRASFVYLAPALAITFSADYVNLPKDYLRKFTVRGHRIFQVYMVNEYLYTLILVHTTARLIR